MRVRSAIVCALALVVVAGAFSGRRRARLEVGGPEPAMAPAPPEPAPSASRSPAAAPMPAEIQPVLDRVFEGLLAVDQADRPSFAAGDFNGDGIDDLAVAVRARDAAALSRLNGELAHWVQDAEAPRAIRPDPVTVVKEDVLLAVVHGVNGGGWRDRQAAPGGVVKNAVGSGLRPRPLGGVPPAVRMSVARAHVGDVIDTSRNGRPGVVVWTGAAYAWAAL